MRIRGSSTYQQEDATPRHPRGANRFRRAIACPFSVIPEQAWIMLKAHRTNHRVSFSRNSRGRSGGQLTGSLALGYNTGGNR